MAKKADGTPDEIRGLLSERVLLDIVPDFAWTKDADGRYVVVNRAAAGAAGRTPADMEGRTDDELWEPAQAGKFRGDDLAVIAAGEGKRVVEHIRTRDGAEKWVEAVKQPVRDAAGVIIGTAGVARDVTEREQVRRGLEAAVQERTRALEEANAALQAELASRVAIEERVRQFQKLEAVGRLANGVAHDFNNLLTIVKSCADALRRTPDAADAQDLVAEIADAARRGAALTRQLLTFSRRRPDEIRAVDLAALVDGTRRMLDRLIGDDVHIALDLAPGLPAVRGDPAQLEQVLVNLVVNARDALPKGGRIAISAGLPMPSRPEVVPGASGRGPFAVLTVRDDGVGMDEAVRSHLFEPFFTTKAPGKGTGLGLATCFGIVQGCGGFITVESAPGEGSAFHVHLPLAPAEEALASPAGEAAPAPAEAPAGAGRTLLLAEDDGAVRSLLRRFLEADGFAVLEADGPEAALRLAGAAPALDGLVTDMVMPGMSGLELASRLDAARPGLKVLFVSASAELAELAEGGLPAHQAFLPKPFDRDGLVQAVRDLLGR